MSDNTGAGNVMNLPLDERLDGIRTAYGDHRFSGPTDLYRERDQVIGYLLDQIDTLTRQADAARVIRNAAESSGRIYEHLFRKYKAAWQALRDEQRLEQQQ